MIAVDPVVENDNKSWSTEEGMNRAESDFRLRILTGTPPPLRLSFGWLGDGGSAFQQEDER